MSLIMNAMEEEHFNLRERLNVYLAIPLGFIAPLLATRCLIYAIKQPQDWQEDLGTWLLSAALTTYPICCKTSMMLTYHTLEQTVEMSRDRREIEDYEKILKSYDEARQKEKELEAEQTVSK